MSRNRILIRGGHILTIDARLGELPRGDILVEGTKIAAIAPKLDVSDAEIVDASGKIVMPGLVDTHRHIWQTVLRNIAADWTLNQYFAGVRGTLGRHFRPEDIFAGNLAGAYEALMSGVTTTLDWSHNMNTPDHADAAVAALKQTGGRFLMCYGNSNDEWLPVSSIPISEDARRVRLEHFASDDQLVTMGMALRGPQYATPEATLQDWAIARDLDVPATVHVGDGAWGKNRPVAWLKAHGLLGPRVICAHCNSLARDEFQMMADCGCKAAMTPEIEMQMGHGWPATTRLREVGIRPSLGVDIVTSNCGNLFQVMRTVLLVERAFANQEADREGKIVERLPIDTQDVVKMATIFGAEALGMDDRIGSLTPGKEADIILIDADNLEMSPMNNAVGAVVLAAHPGLVDSVFVAGRALKRNGKPVGFDQNAAIRKVTQARDYVLEQAGVQPGGRFIPDNYVAAA